MPRFVLLEHDHPTPHLDLMLEVDVVLWTWRVGELKAGVEVAAERLADHRAVYLDYEGPVSGGRGSVRRRARGAYHWLERSPDRLVVRLEGDTLSGVLALWAGQGGWAARLD